MKLSIDEARRNVEGEEMENKMVLVGMKMEARSREILTSALVKIASPGDQVVTMYILPSTAEVPNSDGEPSLISLFKSFDVVLTVYEGYCNLKQILVQEVSSVFASKLILGVSRNSQVIGSKFLSMGFQFVLINIYPSFNALNVVLYGWMDAKRRMQIYGVGIPLLASQVSS